ncbi:MAG: transcription elongation factor GreA [Clostridia bacterium]|nr:transcription elongation factor GreA [Clostridia bacterium]
METVIKLTQAKFDEMNQKLDYLRTVRRSEISDAIKHAKEFGDLSENAEYSAAKEAQVANEAEIARIEDTLALVEIIDEKEVNTKYIGIGNSVVVYDEVEDEEMTLQIVSSLEADSRKNKISDRSPIGKALVGHKKGDRVVAKTPAGDMIFVIKSISKN